MFHGSSHQQTQARILKRFKESNTDLRCVVATVAFGMGVQVKDIRYVLNWGPPHDILTYWQEIGRSGRDGLAAHAIMYTYPYSLNENFVDKSMISLCRDTSENKGCFRKAILEHLFVKGMSREQLDNLAHATCCCVCDKAQSVSQSTELS